MTRINNGRALRCFDTDLDRLSMNGDADGIDRADAETAKQMAQFSEKPAERIRWLVSDACRKTR